MAGLPGTAAAHRASCAAPADASPLAQRGRDTQRPLRAGTRAALTRKRRARGGPSPGLLSRPLRYATPRGAHASRESGRKEAGFVQEPVSVVKANVKYSFLVTVKDEY